MLDKIELDLNNPIFVVYVDTKNFSRQVAEEYLIETKEHFNIYKNITVWTIASDINKVECVYDGKFRTREVELSELTISKIAKEISDILGVVPESWF